MIQQIVYFSGLYKCLFRGIARIYLVQNRKRTANVRKEREQKCKKRKRTVNVRTEIEQQM